VGFVRGAARTGKVGGFLSGVERTKMSGRREVGKQAGEKTKGETESTSRTEWRDEKTYFIVPRARKRQTRCRGEERGAQKRQGGEEMED